MRQPRRPRFKKWLATAFAAATLGLGAGGMMTGTSPVMTSAPDNGASVAMLDGQNAFSIAGSAYAAMSPDQMLVANARSGNVVEMQRAVALGAEIAYNDNEALREAAVVGGYNAADYLLSRGADARAMDSQALKNAASFGHADMVRLLVTSGANVHADGDHALLAAATTGSRDIVNYLIAAGADVNANDNQALRAAIQNGRDDIVAVLLNAGATTDPEMVKDAAMTGRIGTLSAMANHGIDLTGDGVLHRAAMNMKTDAAAFLIDKGAKSTPAMIDMVQHNDLDGKMKQVLTKGLPGKDAPAKTRMSGPQR